MSYWNGHSAREWSLALQSLTPGGSEFASDPEACVEFIRIERRRDWDRIKELITKNRELELKNQNLTREVMSDHSRGTRHDMGQ